MQILGYCSIPMHSEGVPMQELSKDWPDDTGDIRNQALMVISICNYCSSLLNMRMVRSEPLPL